MYALGQNDGSALNVPRDDDLGGGDSQVRRNLLDLVEFQNKASAPVNLTPRSVSQGSP